MKVKSLKKWQSIYKIICLVLCVLLLPVPVHGAGLESSEGTELSLSLHYEAGEAEFSLYKVAEYYADANSGNDEFVLTDSFAGYPVKLSGLDSDGWRAAAETLAGYVSRDGIAPFAEGTTDAEGNLTWSGLENGLYLVLGEISQDEEFIYTPMPLLVVLPVQTESGEMDYHPVLSPKYDREPVPEDDFVQRKVIKVWKDDGYENERPEQITVDLLQNGEVYDTITLNADNNWKYVWTQLPSGYEWKVVEREIADSYIVTVIQEGTTFVITNTYEEENHSEEETENESESTAESDDETQPGEDTPYNPPSGGSGGSGGTLPNTGQLWWPVPCLAICGIVVFAMGWMRRRKWNDRHGK